MSKPEQDSQPEDDGSGCLLLIGVVAVGVSLGHIYSAEVGWLVFGICCIVIGLLTNGARTRRKA